MNETDKKETGDKIPVNWNEMANTISESVNKTVDSVMSYAKTLEEQLTERQRIESNTAITIENIKSIREAVLTDIKGNYDNRALLYVKYFEQLDKYLESNQLDLAMKVLDNIKELSGDSPLKKIMDARNQTNRMLLDNKDINL